MQNDRAPNTVRAYKHSWQRFTKWCTEYNRAALPANAETVRYFAGWCLSERPRKLRLNSVRINLSAIKFKHRQAHLPIPFDDALACLMRGAARKLKGDKGCKKEALTVALLERMLVELESAPGLIAARNRAIFLFGFASGWRRSEIAGLQREDLFLTSAELKMHLGASKTDQIGEGREIRIPCAARPFLCPIRALEAWLQVRGNWPGPLFCAIQPTNWLKGEAVLKRKGIRGDSIAYAVQRSLAKIGEDPHLYGGHSLRAGFITTSSENGANLAAIQHRTGQKSLRTLMRYIRLKEGSRLDPLQGVL
jgi:integrase